MPTKAKAKKPVTPKEPPKPEDKIVFVNRMADDISALAPKDCDMSFGPYHPDEDFVTEVPACYPDFNFNKVNLSNGYVMLFATKVKK
jgi:hypothetical protein